ncbi:copper amine oxidase, partial [Bacillus cereus group sp. N15]|nr:copper amine oxidase [Bacillus cereus group sp. N15]
ANLNEHVYVAGIAVFVAYTDEEGTDSDAFAAAAEVVDDNAVELADAIGELAGDEHRDPFLELWRDHIGYFVDYAEA